LGEDRTLRVWDGIAGETFLSLSGTATGDRSVAVDRTGSRLVEVGILPYQDGKLIRFRDQAAIWDLNRRAIVATIPGTPRPAWTAFTPAGRLLIGTVTARVSEWDPRTGKQVPTRYWIVSGRLTGACPARHLLAIADEDVERVSVWDVSRVPERLVTTARRFSPEDAKKALPPEQWPELKGSFAVSGRVGALVFSPDGGHLLAAPFGRPGKVWDVSTGEAWETPPLAVEGWRPLVTLLYPPVALGPGGGRVVWPFRSELKVSDTRSGAEAVTLGRKGATLVNPVFSADGTKLYALTDNGLMVFDSAPRPPFVPLVFDTAPPPREVGPR
jgi:WD40 repeat protein